MNREDLDTLVDISNTMEFWAEQDLLYLNKTIGSFVDNAAFIAFMSSRLDAFNSIDTGELVTESMAEQGITEREAEFFTVYGEAFVMGVLFGMRKHVK